MEDQLRRVIRVKHYSMNTEGVLRRIDGLYSEADSLPTLQGLLGHSDVRTTQIYTEMARAMRGEITSPLDDL